MSPGKGEPSIDSKPSRFKIRLPLRLVLTLPSIIAAALAWPLSRLDKSKDAFNTMAAQLKENMASLQESEERFRALIEQAPEAILVRDVDTGLFVDANRNAEKLFRCSREELLKCGPERFYPSSQPDNRPVGESMQEYTARALAGETVTFERTVRNIDGREIMCQVWLTRLPSRDRRLIRGSFIDITGRKEAEMKLQASKEYAENLIQTANAMIIGLDTSGNITLFNRAAEKITGYTQAELSGRNWFEVLVPKDRYPFVWDEFNHLHSVGLSRNFENPILTKNGEERHIVWQNNETREHGKIVGSISFGIDITERKRTEERLAKLNKCFLGFGTDPVENINSLTALCGELMGAACALYNRLDKGMLCSWGQWNAPPGYNPIDKPEGHICYDTIQGGSDEVLVVRNLPGTVYARTDPNVTAYNLKTYVGRAVRLGEDYVGSLCVVYQNDFSPDEDDKRLMGVIASAISVEERRRRSEKSFMESEKRFRSIVESASDAIILANGNGRIILWNKGAQVIFGYTEEEMIGKPASFMIPGRYRKKVELVMSTGKSDFFGKTLESTGYRKDGSEFPLEISIATWNIEKEAYYSVIIRDITERKLAEKKLREASLYTRSLIEVNLDPLVTVNLEGRITDVNKATEMVTGVPRETLIGSEFSGYVTEPEKAKEGYNLVLSQGFVRGYPLTIRHTSGKVTEVLFNASVYKNEAGEVQGVFAAARDITERKRAEEALRESEVRFRTLFERAGDYVMVLEIGQDGMILIQDMNEAALRAHGYSHEEIQGRPLYLIDPDNSPEKSAQRMSYVEAGGSLLLNVRHRRKDGSLFDVEANTQMVQIGGKQLIISVERDITERKRAVEELKRSKEFSETILNSMNHEISIIDVRDFRIIDVNQVVLDKLKMKKKDLVGKKCFEIIHKQDTPCTFPDNICPVLETNKTGKFSMAEHIHYNRDGTKEFVEVSASPIKNENGEVIQVVHIAKDITERKLAEEKIMASLKEKEILLREIHHRVKNNMQIISSLLRLQSENIKDEEYLEIFKDSYNRIKTMSLVHEKLYQSKDFTNINIKDYIHDLVGSIYQSHFIDKSIIQLNMNIETVSLGIDTAIPCGLIINELVTNSLKYAFPDGRRGEISIILNRVEKNWFELVVSDNGISIPSDLDFRKTETLGLRLVSMLAEDQLLGEISLDRSKGTEFKIRFRS